MKCPRCGGDMSSGVCDSCGFPTTRKIIRYRIKRSRLVLGRVGILCR